MNSRARIILASRSVRRRELLQLIVPADSIEVIPPLDSVEAGFAGLHDLPEIERRVAWIARAKSEDVSAQVAASSPGNEPADEPVVIAADTVIVARDPAGRAHVLGQPPEDDTWAEVVRGWFHDYYAGRTHLAVTALCVRRGQQRLERVARTEVTFTADVDRFLDWYLATGEPRGKAGGYAIQGAGSLFVVNVAGSLSNVIGLPLEAVREVLAELHVDLAPKRVGT